MITSSNGSMELIITKPHFLPSTLKSHHHYYHHHYPEPSNHSSKEPESHTSEQHTNEVKLRIHERKPIDLEHEHYTISTSSIPIIVSNTNSLFIDENLPVTTTVDKDNRHHHRYLPPICDEELEQFPLSIPSDNHRQSTRSPSYQATLFARRHFHIYDWTRLSFYDNVPAPLGYLSEPLIVEDQSPTSASSNDDKRSSTDRQDSGLGTSSVERQIDSIAITNNIVNQSIASSLSSSSASSLSLNSNMTSPSSVRSPTSRKIRVKWHSFTKTHRPSFNSIKYHLGQMSVGQLLALRRAALVRLEELFDTTKILLSNAPALTTRTVVSRQRLFATVFIAVPKLIIRRHQQRKDTHQETKKLVFGISLLAMTQRTGHPVPSTILSAMKYLRRTSIDSVGIFRKPGVSHRIKRLHELMETDLEYHHFDEFSPYDVSDVLKQYFRLLPECLFTTKLSPLFLHISEYFSSMDKKSSSKVNNERRLLALQYAILLLPDENRLVLHLLLSFLNDVSKHAKTNQMSSMNLATCFTPTLFSFTNYTKTSTNGMPDLKEIEEQRKGMDILAFMIDYVRLLFIVPLELHQACHFSYIEIGEPCTLEELSRRVSEPAVSAPMIKQTRRYSSGKHTAHQRAKEVGKMLASDTVGSSSCDNIFHSMNKNNNNNNNNSHDLKAIKTKTNTSYQTFINRCIVEVMREACSTKSKGWTSFGKTNDIDLAVKKLDDGHPLTLWKCSVEIEAPPTEILNRLLNERHLWDDDFQSGAIIEQLNSNTHVYQYTINSMAPLASRYFCEVRSWRTNIQLNINGTYQNPNFPVGSSLSASSSAITSFISTQNNQSKETCVLVCTSIEHPKAHCPPTLVRAVTLASRYLIQSYGCGKSKVIHLNRVDLMGRSHEWYTKAYGSILTRSMTKLRNSFAHTNAGPETKV
ncbi:unnamed protein product [Adineta ricciae]|uniref:Uncharacterized protein n=1 Tax=Adineta ricciae TaxID=249248 RepID=A0A814CWF8_ADIRI|nr:unnamed protein product [Adineta ricciae]CAF0947816.1 unnamed protein product [Adineta ricciae]